MTMETLLALAGFETLTGLVCFVVAFVLLGFLIGWFTGGK